MDHVKILKRAWQIVTRYRALWIYGAIVALTTSSWIRSILFRGSDGSDRSGAPFNIDLGDGFWARFQADLERDMHVLRPSLTGFLSHNPLPTLIAIGVVAACVVLILIAVLSIARYVSETALIKMVDQYEGSGEPGSVRQGLQMGWSRAAGRIFLINLLVGVLSATAFILALVMAASPLLLLLLGNTAISIISGVAVTGLVFLVIFLTIVISEALGLVRLFAHRACALGGMGVIDAIREGYAIIRQHLKDIGLMWLLTLGIRIGWPLAMLPVAILTIIVAAILGIIIALLVGVIASLFLKGLALLAIVAGVAGVVFVLVLAIPLAFLDGLQRAFLSSTWTLTYRELQTLDGLAAEQPILSPSGPERLVDVNM